MTTQIFRPLTLDKLEAAICQALPHPLLLLRLRPYVVNEHAKLARDILALANVSAQGPRFIAMGVAKNRELHSIGTREQAAVAAALRIVVQNLEPTLHAKCFSWQVRDKKLLMIAISGCDNPPYLVSRDLGTTVQAGDGWIRRHGQTRRLILRDFERYYATRFAEPPFCGDVSIQFAANPPTEIIRLSPIACAKPPSREAKEKIEALIEAQELVDHAGTSQLTAIRRLSFARVLGTEARYEPKSVEDLRAELQSVAVNYNESDRRFKFERQAHSTNFVIHVNGDQAIRSATLILHFPANVGIEIAEETHFQPAERDLPALTRRYPPELQTTSATIRIGQHIELLKPGEHASVFEKPLRIYLDQSAAGYKFPIRYELRARNLRLPITGKLFIVCPKQNQTRVA